MTYIEDLQLSPIVAAARPDLLARGVVVLGEQGVPGTDEHLVEVSAPRDDLAEDIVAEVLPGTRCVRLGLAPRRLVTTRTVGWRESGPSELKLLVEVGEEEHLDDVYLAEDDARVVVLATRCSARFGLLVPLVTTHTRVALERPVGDRTVVDGVTGEPVPHWPR